MNLTKRKLQLMHLALGQYLCFLSEIHNKHNYGKKPKATPQIDAEMIEVSALIQEVDKEWDR